MKVISLGWGVQSFTMAAMSALGELEPVDYMIHADTTHEASWTYSFAEKYTKWLEEHGQKVVTVKPDNTSAIDNGWGWPTIPVFTNSGRGGQSQRQCTYKWKIQPIRRWVRANHNTQPVEQWIGISLDEFQRMKPSDVKYITHRWPLIEKRMTRLDCKNYLVKNNIDIPGRSSCVFCPYHSILEWRNVKRCKSDWNKALIVDNAIRNVADEKYEHFLNSAHKPLDELDLRTQVEKGQMTLWDAECSGMCGV